MAADNVQVPLPNLITLPEDEITPLMVLEALPPNVNALALLIVELNVMPPATLLLLMMELSLPIVTAPANVDAVDALLSRAPPPLMPVPFKVRGPVLVMVVPFKSNAAPLLTDTTPPEPNAVALPTFKVPALMVVPPV